MSKVFPIAEMFTSVQGEGVYTGVMMTFIRLAGCTVGKPFPKESYGLDQELRGCKYNPPVLPIYTEQCTLYDGRHFACDTDYRVKERLTVQEIIDRVPSNVERVCITGGEPLMHDLTTLFTYLWGEKKKIHLETSGTIDEPHISSDIWVTVSPKFNIYLDMITRADELKILVDDDFEPSKSILALTSSIPQAVFLPGIAVIKPVYLQPINKEFDVDEHNLKLCRMIQDTYPQFRISVQLHKVMSDITKELVR